MIDIIVVQSDGSDVPHDNEDLLKYAGCVNGLAGEIISGKVWGWELPFEHGLKTVLFRIEDEKINLDFLTVILLGVSEDITPETAPPGVIGTYEDIVKLIVEPGLQTTSHLMSSGDIVTTITGTSYQRLKELAHESRRRLVGLVGK